MIELEIEAKSLEFKEKMKGIAVLKGKEKMNRRGARWDLYCVLCDRIINRILNNIIFN